MCRPRNGSMSLCNLQEGGRRMKCENCECEIVGIIMPYDLCEDCYDGDDEQ